MAVKALDLRLLFRDTNPEVVAALCDAFGGVEGCSVEQRNILECSADAIVSPANSFGIMDGGIDLAYSVHFGWDLQGRVQEAIRVRFGGFLPVGAAVIVPTLDERVPWLVSAPTMEMPQSIAETRNVYRAMRAVVEAVRLHNDGSPKTGASPIADVLVPGLGTGVGQMDPVDAARQVRQAVDHALRTFLG